MIKYQLLCKNNHSFDAWFPSSEVCDSQAKKMQISCPVCGSEKVSKALMTPAISTSKKSCDRATASLDRGRISEERSKNDLEKLTERTRESVKLLRAIRDHVKKKSDYVGVRFASEARKIHFEEAKPRGIWGEATLDETRELLKDGVPVYPMPQFPEDKN